MGLITYALFGLLVGVVANTLDPRPAQAGLLGALVLGILGSLIGGVLASVLLGINGISGFNLTSFIVALCGAILLLLLGRALRRA